MGQVFSKFFTEKRVQNLKLDPTLSCLELDSKSNTIRISSSQYVMARTFSVAEEKHRTTHES